PQARFFMSADDDIFGHTPNLINYLHRQLGARGLWVGHVHKGAPPVRYKKSKYHVPEELYPWPSYPDYTAGAGYVLSADVAAKIYRATLALNTSMYIDDVFMGICAKSMGVFPQDHAFFSGEGKAPNHPCLYGHMITSHGHTSDVRTLWRSATDPLVRYSSRGCGERSVLHGGEGHVAVQATPPEHLLLPRCLLLTAERPRWSAASSKKPA
ncbi:unnamed protein product, partial [Tetraodon nigroviridis]